MLEIFTLLVLFQLKHFICDYPLQNTFMLGKFKKEGWELPLLAHTGVHFIGTFLICVLFSGSFWLAVGLATLDLVIHFIVDRLKAHPDIGGRFKPEQPEFWWCLGADQSAHHLTHYLITFLLII